MNYRSFEDLNRSIVSHLSKIPLDTDLIVGVPRSGLLAANIAALHLNLPLTDVESFMNGRILQSGGRLKSYVKPFEEYRKVLVLDDSIYSGKSMQEVKEKLKNMYPEKEVLFAAVFAVESAIPLLDFYFEICPWPRVFEWNLMHHGFLENCCVDIDGVLCKDPTEADNDDGVNYEKFLCNAETFFRPSGTIGYLVTNRLEKYRGLTEAWLAKNNIKYKQLIMLDLPDKEARQKAANYGGFKAATYIKNDCWLFIESSEWQARQIAQISGKAVYCVDLRKMIYPNTIGQTGGLVRRFVVKAIKKLKLATY